MIVLQPLKTPILVSFPIWGDIFACLKMSGVVSVPVANFSNAMVREPHYLPPFCQDLRAVRQRLSSGAVAAAEA